MYDTASVRGFRGLKARRVGSPCESSMPAVMAIGYTSGFVYRLFLCRKVHMTHVFRCLEHIILK